jgi:hypothetical protein
MRERTKQSDRSRFCREEGLVPLTRVPPQREAISSSNPSRVKAGGALFGGCHARM